VWRGIFADVFGKPVVTLETQEGSAYGAALLALAGEYSSVAELCGLAIREVEVVRPGVDAGVYAVGYGVYRGLYPALREAGRGAGCGPGGPPHNGS